MQRLIILRGYPGSGKTTVGKTLEDEGYGKFIDHNSILTFITKFTDNDDGIYDDTHLFEQSLARKILTDKKSVIVGRGFTRFINIKPYIVLANSLDIHYDIITLDTQIEILKQRVSLPERVRDYNPTKSAEALNKWIKSNKMENITGETIVDASENLDTVITLVKRSLTKL